MNGVLDPTDLAAVADFERQEKERRELKRLQDADDIKVLLADRLGRRFYFRLLEEAGCFTNPFRGVAALTDFECGKRNLGFYLLGLMMEFAPRSFVEMMNEKEDDDRRAKRANPSG